MDLKAKLTGKAARRYLTVPIPANLGGDSARLQSLSEREKSEYETWLLKGGKLTSDKLDRARRRLLVLTLVDDAGVRLLSDDEEESLLDADGALTSHLYNAATEHCGFSKTDIEDAVKNSARINIAASPSGSRSPSGE